MFFCFFVWVSDPLILFRFCLIPHTHGERKTKSRGIENCVLSEFFYFFYSSNLTHTDTDLTDKKKKKKKRKKKKSSHRPHLQVTVAFVDTPEFKFVEKKNRLKGIEGYFDALIILQQSESITNVDRRSNGVSK